MICPYAVNRVIKTEIKYDDEGKETESIQVQFAKFLLCAQEECGAWKDGRCAYRG
jgi:hypothetical protein